MSDELRAAAERMRKKWPSNVADVQKWDLPYRYIDDLERLADAYLAEHPADDGEPIDHSWLVSIGGIAERNPDKITFHREDALPIGLWRVDDGWKAMFLFAEESAACIARGLSTRGGVRRMLKALGVDVKPV